MAKAACQLATPVDAADLNRYVTNDRFWVEPKLDGARMMIEPTPDGVRFLSRKGVEINPPARLGETVIYTPFTLDGELVNDVFCVFDAVLPGTLVQRHSQLEEFLNDVAFRYVKLVPQAKTTEEKTRMVQALREAGAEGAVIKDSESLYQLGKSKSWLKLKFYRTVDVIVAEINRKGKDEAIGTKWADGSDAGGCKVLLKSIGHLNVGDVIEIRCLGLSNSNKMIQPVFIRKRYDKDAFECMPD